MTKSQGMLKILGNLPVFGNGLENIANVQVIGKWSKANQYVYQWAKDTSLVVKKEACGRMWPDEGEVAPSPEAEGHSLGPWEPREALTEIVTNMWWALRPRPARTGPAPPSESLPVLPVPLPFSLPPSSLESSKSVFLVGRRLLTF